MRLLDAAEALQQAVAVRMRRHRVLADASLIEQPLDHGMVSGAQHDSPVAHEVEAAVADVRPVSVAVLHYAGGNHGTR